MAFDETLILKFVTNLVQAAGEEPYECANWLDQGKPLAKSFSESQQVGALYAIVLNSSFRIVSDLNSVPVSFDLLMALIKQKGCLVQEAPLISQIQVINIPGTATEGTSFQDLSYPASENAEITGSEGKASQKDSYGQIMSLLSFAITPYFNYVAETKGSDTSSASLAVAKKNFSELTLSLRHLQVSIHVPELLANVPKNMRHILSNPDSAHDSAIVGNIELLNDLTKVANSWIQQVQAVTGMSRMVSDESSLQDEVQFWTVLQASLLSLREQILQPEVKCAIEILSAAKRFQITLAFQNNLGVAESLEEANAYNNLLKDLPITDLLLEKDINNEASKSIEQFESVVHTVFSQLKRWKGPDSLNLKRMISLTELLLIAIAQRFSRLLGSLNLAAMPYSLFVSIYEGHLSRLFILIENNVKTMVNVIRELMRKRQEKFMIIKLDSSLSTKLKDRLDSLKSLRTRHEEFLLVLTYMSEAEYHLQNLKLAYSKHVVSSDPFDFSKQGDSLWESSQHLYQDSTSKASQNLSVIINRNLEKCESFNEYSNTLDKLSGGFQSAISSFILSFVEDRHKLSILDLVSTELENMLELSYLMKERTSCREGITSIFSEICWEASLNAKIEFYILSLKKLLGTDWNSYSAGVRIESMITNYRQKANMDEMFETWVDSARKVSEDQQYSGGILQIASIFDDGSFDLTIRSNTDIDLIISQGETFLNLGLDLPTSMRISLDRHKAIQPIKFSLSEHISLFHEIVSALLSGTEHGVKLGFLMDEQKIKIFNLLKLVQNMSWPSVISELKIRDNDIDRSETFHEELTCLSQIESLQDAVHDFHVQFVTIHNFHDRVYNKLIPEFAECEYSSDSLTRIVSQIQNEATRVVRGEFCHLQYFIRLLNQDISGAIHQRCQSQIDQLADALSQRGYSKIDRALPFRSTHTIINDNGSLRIEPPLEAAKTTWFESVNATIRLTEGNLLISANDGGRKIESIGLKNTIDATRVMNAIEKSYADSAAYFEKWRAIEQIFSTESKLEERMFPPDLSMEECLSTSEEILNLMQTFENPQGTHTVNDVTIISFLDIRPSFISKLTSLSTLLFEILAQRSQCASKECFEGLEIAQKSLLRGINFDCAANLLMSAIEEFYSYHSKLHLWTEQIRVLGICQSYLRRRSISTSSSWLHVEQLEGQLSNVKQLVSQGLEVIKSNLDLLSSSFNLEWMCAEEAVSSLIFDWSEGKPIAATLEPRCALTAIRKFDERVKYLSHQIRSLSIIANHLSFEVRNKISLEPLGEDIDELKLVWITIQKLWDNLDNLKSQKWVNVHVRDLKKSLEGFLSDCNDCPVEIRQYSAFNSFQISIKAMLKRIPILFELKTEAMKDRHWQQLFRSVGLQPKTITLLHLKAILEINFDLNESLIRNILDQANGEHLVEEGLDNIEKDWTTVTFETFNHAGKCRLIKNWSDLFDQCNANLSTLASIKNSLFFGQFERERDELESKINNLIKLFNIWIEVQRQWAYLDGIFGSNSEIKASLPLESARFSNLSFEFLNLLKKANSLRLVIDVLSIKDIHATMQKLSDSLMKTTRGLSDFLDHQRDRFPRFFFIGNEDLLELLGCGNSQIMINKHLKRMFPGISSVSIDDQNSQILAIMSPQGEAMKLEHPVSLIKHRSLTDWTRALELEIRLTMSSKILQIAQDVEKLGVGDISAHHESVRLLIEKALHQALIVAFQVKFSMIISAAKNTEDFDEGVSFYESLMSILTGLILVSENTIFSSKVRGLIVECLHHKEVLLKMIDADRAERHSIINSQQLFFYTTDEKDPLQKLQIRQGRFESSYGFEFLGIVERLANTPLVNKCFVAMTQALAQKLGGSPFGPAGTGKTECVKALGHNLGRMVLVFCCDDSFDYQSMGRILLGVCKVGCFGCFDEFNRLEPVILSSLSTQIEQIEVSLQNSRKFMLLGKEVSVNPATGIFVTMNPDYVGRHELPENLKKLFRGFSMGQPDAERIAEVLLASHGFNSSQELATKLIPFFSKLDVSMSRQSHYDFGLRALKSILIKAGSVKKEEFVSQGQISHSQELKILLKALYEAVAPKLISSDHSVFQRMLSQTFKQPLKLDNDSSFASQLESHVVSKGLVFSTEFLRKAIQVFQVQQAHHGFMLIGSSGSGKSTVLNSVLETLSKLEGAPYQKITIDSKVLTKEGLFGHLDSITRDWTDGLLTKTIRDILSNLKGELDRRTWIVFDGDIDPVWAENLNSLLDDNKLLTLPNGERLELPSNVRIVFEVQDLGYATPATVSRCGMIWFDSSLVSLESLWSHQLVLLKTSYSELINLDDWLLASQAKDLVLRIADLLTGLNLGSMIEALFQYASNLSHIMDFDKHRVITGLFVHLKIYISDLLQNLSDFSDVTNLETFVHKAFALSLIWAFCGDSNLEDKEKLNKFIQGTESFSEIELPNSLCHYKISFPDFEWQSWAGLEDDSNLEPHQVLDPSTMVSTVDTRMHEYIIKGVINKHSPLILCGPPGSGKTMTFLKALKSSPNLELINLNFSKDTTPEMLLSTLEQHCEYKSTNQGQELCPKVEGKWVVVFCDEINLPGVDNFGTQRVISFMRQLVERAGFWRASNLTWVPIRNIQFVGACNDPKDPGRNKLADRFMRHVTLVLVNYPGCQALSEIYTTFNRAILKCAPNVGSFFDSLTKAMIQVYNETKAFLNTEKQSHYIYSPRELTRWCRGILETLMDAPDFGLTELIRLWYHEGLRLFHDRLVDTNEKHWCLDLLKRVADTHFPGVDLANVLKGPVFYSTWISGKYESVSDRALAIFVKERLRIFSEEEMDHSMIMFEDMLDHALRIDRVMRQRQGHMIMVGPSTSGKTSLTKFVAWMNGMKLIQLRVHSNYSVSEFETALREVLTLCARGEQVCFLIDESSILEPSFIERMNSLLANSEIPGLFEGENLDNLIKLCAAEASSRDQFLDTTDEIYTWFTTQITENLHVVFTMSELRGTTAPQINSSPALFNRCVLSWMGDWSNSSLIEVAEHLLDKIPLAQSDFIAPADYEPYVVEKAASLKSILVDMLVFIHRSKPSGLSPNVPKQFLDFIELFISSLGKGQLDLEERQRHTHTGLDKLRETVLEVSQMKKAMSKKKEELEIKDEEARRMLNKMIVDQNESERKREFSVETKAELEKQESEIQARRLVVMNDLELAEPAVIEAQQGVQNIKKQHLTELRSMSNPPASIKLAMESVCVLLGYQVNSWRDVQLIVRQDDFITKIVAFDNESQLSPAMRSHMEAVYLSRPDYNFETIHRASKACGPLLQWVVAQIRYSEILVKIGPLREQVAALESYAMKSRAQLIAIAEMIGELEQSIEKYKTEYSEVIRQAEKIKTEMEDIELKVSRSMRLIEKLTVERHRWEASTKDFSEERERLVGNCILGSAFSIYCGSLDQRQRWDLISFWKARLTLSCIKFDSSRTIASLLSTNTDQNAWARKGLPDDEIFVENFAIKTRSEFPLIIDPTGAVLPVLENLNPEKLVVTTFLKDSFTKVVEDALRFGGTVLIENAELYNPILDSVLRKDVSQNGGRRVVTLGTKSMVLSDQFQLLLYTRDSRAALPAFLQGRSNILNFTITKSNIENRIMNASLSQLDPDLDRKRVELGALQSDYSIRSLSLRKQLLSTLNEVRGAFIENDDVIQSLEVIEIESSTIDEKMRDAEKVMHSVNESRLLFRKVAHHSNKIFEVLMSISKPNRFYNFSFGLFIDLFKTVLTGLTGAIEPDLVIQLFYELIYAFCSPTLREQDKVVLRFSLALSQHSEKFGPDFKTAMLKLLASSPENTNSSFICSIIDDLITKENEDDSIRQWSDVVEKYNSESDVGKLIRFTDEYFGLTIPRDMSNALETYARDALGNEEARELTMVEWIKKTKSPHILSTSDSYDMTFQIEMCAKLADSKLRKAAMGTSEGVKAVNEALKSAMREGEWVLIQNAHLAGEWLKHLKGMLQDNASHENFRIFLTCSLDATNIPNELIGISSVRTTEIQPKWGTILSDTFKLLVTPATQLMEMQILFLLSWYHAIIQERLNYAPISFGKKYDINESDFRAAAFAISKMFGKTKSNPGRSDYISHKEIAFLVGDIIYGGKMSIEKDSEYCAELARSLFSAESHKPGFNLLSDASAKRADMVLPGPEADSIDDFMAWIDQLPESPPLEWLGLSNEVSAKAKDEEAKLVSARVCDVLRDVF